MAEETKGIGQAGSIRTARFGHNRAFDGLRGVCILAVMAFHAPIPRSSAGFLGVDVFFVLSGFLITSILVKEIDETSAIDVREFYIRRAARLVPALLLLIAAIVAFGILLAPQTMPQIVRGTVATLLYVQNWAIITGVDVHRALTHTWSLSIEEQFYLLWPVSLWILVRSGRSRSVAAVVCAALAAGSSSLRLLLYLNGAVTSRVYNGSDTRADAILAGCAVALAFSAVKPGAISRALLIAGRISILGAIVYLFSANWQHAYSSSHLYLGGFSLIAVAAAALVAELHLGQLPWLRATFELAPLVWLGEISYGLYLWHFPIMLRIKQPILSFAVTIAVAGLSYYAIEKPIRNAVRNARQSRNVAAKVVLAAHGDREAEGSAPAGGRI